MEHYLFLLLSLLLFSRSEAQPYVLYQGNNEALYMENIADGNWQKLSSEAFGELAGYELAGDSLVVYMQIRGKLQPMKFSDPVFKQLERYSNCFNPPYEENHISPRIFTCKNYTLVIDENMCLYNDGKHMWGEYCNNDTFKRTMHWLTGYIHPQISPDLSTILCEAKRTPQMGKSQSKVIEIDISTGKQKTIVKGSEPTYSPDGKYILYRDNSTGYWNIFNRQSSKVVTETAMLHAFWLHR